jgi:hypothetical protein
MQVSHSEKGADHMIAWLDLEWRNEETCFRVFSALWLGADRLSRQLIGTPPDYSHHI